MESLSTNLKFKYCNAAPMLIIRAFGVLLHGILYVISIDLFIGEFNFYSDTQFFVVSHVSCFVITNGQQCHICYLRNVPLIRGIFSCSVIFP